MIEGEKSAAVSERDRGDTAQPPERLRMHHDERAPARQIHEFRECRRARRPLLVLAVAEVPLDQLDDRPTGIPVERPERVEHFLRQRQRDQL